AGRLGAGGNWEGGRAAPGGGRTLSSRGASAGRAWLGTSGGKSGDTGWSASSTPSSAPSSQAGISAFFWSMVVTSTNWIALGRALSLDIFVSLPSAAERQRPFCRQAERNLHDLLLCGLH